MDGHMRLRWTSHQGTILSVLDALLSSESMVDVTLACEGQYIRAHKLILSACSPYFQVNNELLLIYTLHIIMRCCCSKAVESSE